MKQVFDFYFFQEKLQVLIMDDKILYAKRWERDPLVLWDKQNCCISDTADLSFVAQRKWVSEEYLKDKGLI